MCNRILNIIYKTLESLFVKLFPPITTDQQNTRSCAFCPEEGGVVQHFTPEQTNKEKLRSKPWAKGSVPFEL